MIVLYLLLYVMHIIALYHFAAIPQELKDHLEFPSIDFP